MQNGDKMVICPIELLYLGAKQIFSSFKTQWEGIVNLLALSDVLIEKVFILFHLRCDSFTIMHIL